MTFTGKDSNEELQNLREECNMCMENKLKRIQHRGQYWPALTSQRSCLHTCKSQQGLGAEVQASGIGTQKEDWGWLLWRYSEGVHTTQLRKSREKPWSARETRDFCHGERLTPCTCRLCDPTFVSAIGGMSSDCNKCQRQGLWQSCGLRPHRWAWCPW